MWYKFWTRTGDAAGTSDPEVRWEWSNNVRDEKVLKEDDEEAAREIAYKWDCRGYAGHEGPFDTLPEDVAAAMLKEAEGAIGGPERYLAVLRRRLGVPVPMSNQTPSVFDEIKAELDRQQSEWGGPSHDDTHDARDWHILLNIQMGKLADALLEGRQSPRRRMIQIAAVCVSAVESMDRRRAKS